MVVIRTFLLACSLSAGVLVVQGAARGGGVFPGKTWATRTPDQAGLDVAKLNALRDFVGGRGCVVRGGHLVFSWGDVAKRADLASACKPWFVHFLLLSLDQGTLKSLDDPVALREPRLNPLNPGLKFKDRSITWRHLANQTSCYGVREAPGAAYDYSDYNMALFFDALLLKVYDSRLSRIDADVLRSGLTDLLGCEDDPTFLAFGERDRPGRLAVSVRDACRFGLLYLRGGDWNGKRLLSARLARMAVTSPLPNAVPRTQGEKAEMIPGQCSIGGGNNQTDHLAVTASPGGPTASIAPAIATGRTPRSTPMAPWATGANVRPS
jgi:hypothetical protein